MKVIHISLCKKLFLLLIYFLTNALLIHANNDVTENPLKVAVIGSGYVGTVSAAGFAQFGNEVIGADVDEKKINGLNQGIMPIYEKGLKELVDENVQANRLKFSTDIGQAVQQSDVIIIAVGTPMAQDGSADLKYIKSVVETIAQNMNGYKVICTKSTVPPKTGQNIRNLLEQRGVDPQMFAIASIPEFLREGSAVSDFLKPDRVVIGTETEKSDTIMRKLFTPLITQNVPIESMNVVSSELTKYGSNAELAHRISFTNELANLCDKLGADVKAVTRAMGRDKRIGPSNLEASPGFGGSCFEKDLHALFNIAKKNQVDMPTVLATIKTNEMQKKKPAEKILRLLQSDVAGKTITILGLAFKANTDDVRDTPALTTIQILQSRGAIIKAYDPKAMDQMRTLAPDIIYCASLEEAVKDADGIIVMTEWDEFKHMNLQAVGAAVKNKVIVDARNILDVSELKRNGFAFDNIGRSYLAQ